MTLANTHANFAPRIFHPKTLDRLADDIATPDLRALKTLIAATEAADGADYHANQWPRNGIAWYCFSQPNDPLRLDRDETGYTPRLGALKNFDAIAHRFGLTVAEARDLFCGDDLAEPAGKEARLLFLERLDEFICDHQESSECRACSDIYYVDPDKAAEAMYCPACEAKHARMERGGL